MKKISVRTGFGFFLICALLTACGGQNASSTPLSSSGAQNGVPIATIADTSSRNPIPTTVVAANTPEGPQQPVEFGEPVTIGHYTVVVHNVQQYDWLESHMLEDPVEEKRLFVDISIRNDSSDPAFSAWSSNNHFAIVLPDGTPLNSEWFELEANQGAGVGLFPKGLQSKDCGGDGSRAGRAVRFFTDLMPGQVSRGWINFKLTPGVDQPGNLLAVTLRQMDNSQPQPVLFQLTGTPKADPLPWAGDANQPQPQVTVEKLVLSAGKALPANAPKKPRAWQACAVSTREVTLKIKNTDSRSMRFNKPVYAVDAEGRVYGEFGNGSNVELGPQEEKDVSFTFLSILGLEQAPVALLIGPQPGSEERILISVTE